MNVFDKIADFARQIGAAYFDDEPTWGTSKEWEEFYASGRRPGDGLVPGPPPPPRPIYLPSTRNHGKRSSTGPLVLISAASEVSGAGQLGNAPAVPSFAKRGLFGTFFGPPARTASGGQAPGLLHDRAWLAGGRADGRRR